MAEYRVIIPEEEYSLVEFQQDDAPSVGVINTALRDFEPKVVFGWHLSLMLQLDDLIDKGMPSRAEREVVDRFGDSLDMTLKGKDASKPNALFLARITWNATRELIWRVFDPELANHYLQPIINEVPAVRPRPFDFRIDHDPDWELTKWHLADHNADSTSN